MLFSVEAFAFFPIFRRRIQVRAVPNGVTSCVYSRHAVDASSGSVSCYSTPRAWDSGSTIANALCGGVDERDIRGTRCSDVGTAVQIVSLPFSSW